MKNMSLFVLIFVSSFLGICVNAQSQKLVATVIMSKEEAERLERRMDNNNRMLKSEHSEADKLSMLSQIRGRNTDEYKAMDELRSEIAEFSKDVEKCKSACENGLTPLGLFINNTTSLGRFINEDCKKLQTLNALLKKMEDEEKDLTFKALSTPEYKAMQQGQLLIDPKD